MTSTELELPAKPLEEDSGATSEFELEEVIAVDDAGTV